MYRIIMHTAVLLTFVLCTAVTALDSADNKFIKDYAMLKIYESCFGTALLKQIAAELKEAYAKCSLPPPMRDQMNQHVPPILLSKLPPGFAMDPNTQTITRPTDGVVNNNQENDLTNQEGPQQQPKVPVGSVLAFRPNGNQYQSPAMTPFMMPGMPQLRPYNAPVQPFPYGGMYYPPGMPYNPYYQQQFQQAQYYPQPYFGNNRVSRQLNLRTRLGLNRPSNENVTCVMQALGYVDHNLEPNYELITQRINNLPVSNELKSDIQEGLNFCQKFSQCVPEDKRNIVPRPQEQIKAIFFFRCYKHKKLEACIMKDISQHFSKEYVVDTEPEFGSFSRAGRSTRDAPARDPGMEALEEMEVYLYDYLSGGGAFDFDLYI